MEGGWFIRRFICWGFVRIRGRVLGLWFFGSWEIGRWDESKFFFFCRDEVRNEVEI